MEPVRPYWGPYRYPRNWECNCADGNHRRCPRRWPTGFWMSALSFQCRAFYCWPQVTSWSQSRLRTAPVSCQAESFVTSKAASGETASLSACVKEESDRLVSQLGSTDGVDVHFPKGQGSQLADWSTDGVAVNMPITSLHWRTENFKNFKRKYVRTKAVFARRLHRALID